MVFGVLEVMTEAGGPVGAAERILCEHSYTGTHMLPCTMTTSNGYLSPASRVISMTVLLTALLPAELDAVTVMV